MILDQQQSDERAETVRALLARPLLTRDADPDTFRLAAVHRDWLTAWFDRYCGWTFTIDVPGGTARLGKRRSDSDATRPAVRPTDGQPFDSVRYVLLMCVCAELVARPHVTISDLADNLTVVCGADDTLPDFDPANHRHRYAFADVLRWLADQQLVTVTAGALDNYSTHGRDAVIVADVARLALLPASSTAPSRMQPVTFDGWLDALTDEPRYGGGTAETSSDEQRNLHARHTLIRAVLDDPAVDVDTLDEHVRDYLASLTGRQLLSAAVRDAGMDLERHADVLVAVDQAREATDATFGDSASTVAQTAGVLLTELVDGYCTLRRRSRLELERAVQQLLDADEGWARTYQPAGGAHRLTSDALELLARFGLATVGGATVEARPAAARFDVTVTDYRNPAPSTGDAPQAPALLLGSDSA